MGCKLLGMYFLFIFIYVTYNEKITLFYFLSIEITNSTKFQVLVFFAVAEYGLLLHTKSHRSKTYEISPQQPNDKQGCIKIGKKKYTMPLLDKIAIVALPLLFIIFNVIYWSVYTT